MVFEKILQIFFRGPGSEEKSTLKGPSGCSFSKKIRASSTRNASEFFRAESDCSRFASGKGLLPRVIREFYRFLPAVSPFAVLGSGMSLSKFLPVALLCVIGFTSAASAQYIGPQHEQKVLFLGDSITYFGFILPCGYLHLIDNAMKHQTGEIKIISAGISGQTSKDMLGRFGSVLAQKPDWMLLSCGVNDVWHGAQGVPLDQYKTNIASMVDQARAAGIKVTILASTPIGYDNFQDANNTKLKDYNAFLRELAVKDNLIFVDLNKAMADGCTAIKQHDPHQQGQVVTMDGVHPNALGYEIMAAAILKAWGFTDAQMDAVDASWQQMPEMVSYAWMGIDPNHSINLQEYLALRAYAESHGESVPQAFYEILDNNLKQIAATNPKNEIDPAKLGAAGAP